MARSGDYASTVRDQGPDGRRELEPEGPLRPPSGSQGSAVRRAKGRSSPDWTFLDVLVSRRSGHLGRDSRLSRLNEVVWTEPVRDEFGLPIPSTRQNPTAARRPAPTKRATRRGKSPKPAATNSTPHGTPSAQPAPAKLAKPVTCRSALRPSLARQHAREGRPRTPQAAHPRRLREAAAPIRTQSLRRQGNLRRSRRATVRTSSLTWFDAASRRRRRSTPGARSSAC